ncbi:MAG: tryptophan synthase subunit alpha [Thioalkalispiraceae bacterium]|jgi:tryptophan synthase alpha chain
MSRIEARFAARKGEGRKVLIPYITAGDPQPDVTVNLMHAMVLAGADIIELGIPFSDPMAEGPVIQKAMERALINHVSLHDVLEMVKAFRQQDNDTPIILMGYLNPVEVMGYEQFASQAAEAGIDGILTVDMPPEEARDYISAMQAHGLDCIFLVSPTTDEARIETVCQAGSGFIYYVSLKGVTGAGNLDINEVTERVLAIRRLTDLPVGVGFGIKDAESATRIAATSDAVVVGSAIVRKVEENTDSADKINQAVSGLLTEIRSALDAM